MNINLWVLVFLLVHWHLSLFFHSGFLHRYASHQMYTMSPRVMRVFYFMTWFTQGSSYLIPRGYAPMHRMHHEYSDTELDPHSPWFFKDVFTLMVHTRNVYNDIVEGRTIPESEFTKDVPAWDALDAFGDHWMTRLVWACVYVCIYVLFIHYGASPFWLLALPIHFLIGPVQGAFVNWGGHKYGYQNYANGDHSHNTLPIDIALSGELYQNNHHKFPKSLNFAKRWFEFDPTYQELKILDWLKIIRIQKE